MHNFLVTYRLNVDSDQPDKAVEQVQETAPNALTVWTDGHIDHSEGSEEEREPRCTVYARVMIQSSDPRLPMEETVMSLGQASFSDVTALINFGVDEVRAEGEGPYESAEVLALGRMAYDTNTDPASVPFIAHMDEHRLAARFNPAFG
jgi:hypothetical protein